MDLLFQVSLSHMFGKCQSLFVHTQESLPYSPAGLPFDWHLVPLSNKVVHTNNLNIPSPFSSPPIMDEEMGVGMLRSIREDGNISTASLQATSKYHDHPSFNNARRKSGEQRWNNRQVNL